MGRREGGNHRRCRGHKIAGPALSRPVEVPRLGLKQDQLPAIIKRGGTSGRQTSESGTGSSFPFRSPPIKKGGGLPPKDRHLAHAVDRRCRTDLLQNFLALEFQSHLAIKRGDADTEHRGGFFARALVKFQCLADEHAFLLANEIVQRRADRELVLDPLVFGIAETSIFCVIFGGRSDGRSFLPSQNVQARSIAF